MMPRIEGIEEQELRNLYDVEMMSYRNLAGYFDVSRHTIENRMKEYGIEPRLPISVSNHARRYKVNDSFFKTWTPESAWLYGWAIGDGNFTTSYTFGFALGRIDREVLGKFRRILSSEHKIKDYVAERWGAEHEMSKIGFYSINLVNDLKSLSFYKVPEWCFNHALRGFFEAEGCVYWHKMNRPKGGLINSSIKQNDKDLLMFIRRHLNQHGIVDGGSIHPQRDNGWLLEFGKYDSISLYHYMYDDCGNIFLKRKKEKFEELMDKEVIYIDRH